VSEGSLGILEGRVKLELCRVPQASGSQPSAQVDWGDEPGGPSDLDLPQESLLIMMTNQPNTSKTKCKIEFASVCDMENRGNIRLFLFNAKLLSWIWCGVVYEAGNRDAGRGYNTVPRK